MHLDTLDSSLFFVNDYSVDIAAEDNRHSCLVFSLCRFAQVHYSSTYTWKQPSLLPRYQESTKTNANLPTWEHPLQTRQRFLQLCIPLRLGPINAGLLELQIYICKPFVRLCLLTSVKSISNNAQSIHLTGGGKRRPTRS
jgi:hypothetical protein